MRAGIPRHSETRYSSLLFLAVLSNSIKQRASLCRSRQHWLHWQKLPTQIAAQLCARHYSRLFPKQSLLLAENAWLMCAVVINFLVFSNAAKARCGRMTPHPIRTVRLITHLSTHVAYLCLFGWRVWVYPKFNQKIIKTRIHHESTGERQVDLQPPPPVSRPLA